MSSRRVKPKKSYLNDCYEKNCLIPSNTPPEIVELLHEMRTSSNPIDYIGKINKKCNNLSDPVLHRNKILDSYMTQ